MIQLTAQTRILVTGEPLDLRKGIDGIACICRRILQEDPLNGTVFIFINRRKTQIKALAYDGQGFWLMQKRLSSGSFPFWPRRDQQVTRLRAEQAYILLRGGNPFLAPTLEEWRKIS
jgi:transposase